MNTIGLAPNPPCISGAPTHCAHCKQPLLLINGHVEAWRSSNGGYYCNEFCAEDDEEAAVQFPAERPLLHHCRGWGAL